MLSALQQRLVSAQYQAISKNKQRYISLTAKLDALSPLKVLTRGYAMVQDDRGEVVRSVNQVVPNQDITISVSDGRITASVLTIKENLYESRE